MTFAHMLHPSSLLDLPFDVIWNFHNLQFSAVPIGGLRAEILQNRDEVPIVSRDEYAAPIQARLLRTCPCGPEDAKVWLLERLALA